MGTALLVIDYTESCCLRKYERPQWGCTLNAVRAIAPKIAAAVETFRRDAAPVVWVRPCPWIPGRVHPNITRLYARNKDAEFYTDGTGAESFYLVQPLTAEPVFEKNSYSAFSGTSGELHSHLQAHTIGRLVITGVYSTGCVNATICEAFHLGYELTMLSDCVQTFDREVSQDYQRHLLREWAYNYGEVRTSNEFLRID